MRFPTVRGANLLRRKVTLPDDLGGELNLLFIAFQQWQQAWVDTWVPSGRSLEAAFPALRFYELPVIQNMNFVAQTFINEGMRAGIPNPLSREKTITLYLDKAALRQALDLPSEDTIWILLADREGNILWREQGMYTSEKGAALLQVVQESMIGGENG
jgi:hypothetical protein